ncbi:hypothetical protein GCM10011515_08730 [Tsuneonella deserti]|uniref:Uncharacterized protein n=1 Tax=Tsuneonella deserti TaxID=2035528 RepID=A0ABQ1S5Q6_9SPHN|nr:hypothetical protein GCM10011515_08730 [Tsuneonella deserti]
MGLHCEPVRIEVRSVAVGAENGVDLSIQKAAEVIRNRRFARDKNRALAKEVSGDRKLDRVVSQIDLFLSP